MASIPYLRPCCPWKKRGFWTDKEGRRYKARLSPRWSLTAHGLGIIETLELARLTQRLPAQIVLMGIEIECEENFRLELSPEVEKAIPLAADAVQKEIQIILKNI